MKNKHFIFRGKKQCINKYKMLILYFFLVQKISCLKTLSRRSRGVDVGSVLIENETDEILKVHIESND